MSGEYELKRLQDLPSTDRLPPGRYLLKRGERTAAVELEFFTNVDRSALANALRRFLGPRPVSPYPSR